MATDDGEGRNFLEDVQSLVMAGLVIAALVHVAVRADIPLVIGLHNLSGWLFALAWPLLLAAAWRRRPRRAALCAALALAHLWWIRPPGPRAAADDLPSIRLASVNLYGGNVRGAELIAELEGFAADLVLVQELTPAWEARLAASAVAEDLPHGHVVVRTDAFGIGIWSRLPLVDAETRWLGGVPSIAATVQIPGWPDPTRVIAVHTLPPISREYAVIRREQVERLREWMVEAPGPVIAVGDLNLTPHDPLYGELVGGGIVDAYASCGRWIGWTWPNGRVVLPPIRLDHVLHTADVACVSIREGTGAGSDHRPILAELAGASR